MSPTTMAYFGLLVDFEWEKCKTEFEDCEMVDNWVVG